MQYPTDYDVPLTGLDWLEYYPAHRVFHPAVDFNKGYGNADCGQPVYCPLGGKVVYVHLDAATSGGFGRFVIIKHGDGNYTRSAHLKDCAVNAGEDVNAGQIIGHVGNTGTTYCHLHFEVFNESCAQLQRKHSRPWRFYPSGWTKEKVQRYYLNPWSWLETPLQFFDLEDGYKWITDNELVKTSKPKDTVTVDMLGVILKRAAGAGIFKP